MENSNKRIPTGKTYEIKNFEQLVNIATEENIVDLMEDFGRWLYFTLLWIKEARKLLPKKDQKKTNWEITKCTFIWQDDGGHDLNAIKVRNEVTGEVHTLTLTPPKQ